MSARRVALVLLAAAGAVVGVHAVVQSSLCFSHSHSHSHSLSLEKPASAQSVDPRRARTFLVAGARARGASPTDRVDAARTAFSRVPLPASNLRVEWRKALGASIEHAPIVDDAGNVYVVAGRGDVALIAPDSTERWRAVTGAVQAGPAALLADGTIVFVSAGGEAVGVRAGTVRFRTRVGRAEGVAPRVAPIALDDGGVALGTASELTVLDAEGNVRARAATPEAVTVPLVSALGKIVVIGATGTVYAWSPGKEPARIGSFGSPIDGAAALSDDHTLVAVTHAGAELTAVDLAKNVTVTRSVPPVGVYLGPPAMKGDVALVVHYAQTGSALVAIDANGLELARVVVTSAPPLVAADGGVAALVVPPHAGPLVDGVATVVVASPEGAVGAAALSFAAPAADPGDAGASDGGATLVTSGGGTLELVNELVCARTVAPGGRPSSWATGLAPAGKGTFIVSCSNGALVKIAGSVR